jgi:hypothetical protein
MDMLFAVPDAVYNRLAMWHIRRKYSNANSIVRMLYVALILTTLGNVYINSPIRMRLAASCIMVGIVHQLQNATRVIGAHISRNGLR